MPDESSFIGDWLRRRVTLRCAVLSCLVGQIVGGMVFATAGYCDETAPSPCGKSFVVSGGIKHYSTPQDLVVRGEDKNGTYSGEVYGPSFTAKVEGLPEGVYTVKIDLAEIYYRGPGQRVMRIVSGNTVLADHLDLVAQAGFAKAYQVSGKIHHDDDSIGGPLRIIFTSIHGDAKFNAIHIYDSLGAGVACVKAVDLVDVADAATSRIPQITTAEIYSDSSQPMDARIDDLISRMSLAEKAGQLVNAAPAIPRLHIPAYDYWNECLHGVGRNGHATVFPQAIGMAATFDDALIYCVGQVIADEARAKYYQAVRDGQLGKDNHGLNFWAPNVNIFRDPRWGRGQETYGEDPFLTSRIAVGFITGLQQTKGGYLEVMACAKHFAVHSGPEAGRGSLNVDPEPRDLHETYLPQFQAAVQEAHVGAVMASYNSIYHIPNAANHWLLDDLLRGAWGFQGHVVSDCGAVGNISNAFHFAKGEDGAAAAALNAGLDLECGGTFRALPKAISEGLTTEKALDAALHRVLEIRFRLGLFDPPDKVPFSSIPMSDVECPEHLALARQTARESIVLLKNDGILPLDKTKLKRIAVLGANARNLLNGNYNGDPTHTVTLLEGIQKEAGNIEVDFAKGAPLTRKPNHSEENVSSKDYQKAIDMASQADVIIYIGGLDTELEGEESDYASPGFTHGDRTRIELPSEQEKILHDLQATGKPVVFVNCTGSAVAMPWEARHLSAIVQAWYPGGEGGTAVADILFGKCNPSGRLPITFYARTADLPAFTDYRMANRTYRYFAGLPLFPFGFGLSYTTFRYGPILTKATSVSTQAILHLEVPIQNIGTRDGDEVVQVYLKHLKSPASQPIRSLIAFQRVSLVAGGNARALFDVPVERFHYWDAKQGGFTVDPGAYEIEVGASSSDIRQTCQVTVTSHL
jgi:beta-glucosidase